MKQLVDYRAVLDCIGFGMTGDGSIAVRFQLAAFRADGSYVDDGARTGPAQKNKYRFTLRPGDDIDALLEHITPHLEVMGYSPPSDADIAKLKAVARLEWTPAVLAAHVRQWEAWEASNEAHCRTSSVASLTLHQGRMIDFAQRLETSLADFIAPSEPAPAPAITGGVRDH